MIRRKKMILKICLCLFVFLILLDFIPIKMAVNIKNDDLTKYKKSEEQKVYICKYVEVTGSIWQVIGDEKGERKLLNNGVIYLADPLHGNNPLKKLNYAFQRIYEPQAHNGFVFIGKEGQKVDEAGDITVDFKVENWRIIYPIRRDSIRDIYAPKSYLTIYDFIP